MRGATKKKIHELQKDIFQPTRPLRGATIYTKSQQIQKTNFNPRAPCGARQVLSIPIWVSVIFQPTRPLRGATSSSALKSSSFHISTHAPLAGRDRHQNRKGQKLIYFNPRAPCGARRGHSVLVAGSGFISTHAPLAGRDIMDWFGDTFFIISTHAPLAGRDAVCVKSSDSSQSFQPTRPLRGATRPACGHLQHL